MRRVTALTVWLLSAALPEGALCQDVPRAESGASARVDGALVPDIDTRREIVLFGAGAGLVVAGHFMPVNRRVVPTSGLDPAEIGWGTDRDVIGRASVDADHASTFTRNAALVFPIALAVTIASSGNRWHALSTRGVVYAETLLVSQGVTLLGKTLADRARPYAYLAEVDRPDDPSYDVTAARTFRSMPSGHSSSAWTGATMGMTEHLLSRPAVPWAERLAVGFVGGGLAGATSSLRVAAGQHFPSDVIVGAGIGVVTGVAVPLLHRGSRPMPSATAWMEMLGGAVAGTLVGIATTR